MKDLKIPNEKVPSYTKEELVRLQKAFGYSYEDYKDEIKAMATNGAEHVGAMGIDTPIAVLSKHYQPLFYYFKPSY